MAKYALRQLLITIPVLAGISLVLFTIIAMAPGDPFEELATNPNVPPEVRMNLRAKFGLDDPLPIRYARWMGAMVRGDWGFSFVSRVNVDTLILQRLPTSLPWRPVIYRADSSATGWRWYWEHLRQAIMPVAVLGLFQGAALTRFMRSAVLDVVRLDFVNTARAKGLSERATVVKHVVRNALIPVVTLLALQVPAVFGGAIITEQIFRIPGIGSLLISSILANDTPVVMAITFVLSAPIVLSNFVADLLYGWLDPRISYR